LTQVVMRRLREGEIPFAAGTAVQEQEGRPVFRGNGALDYVCVHCGALLATAMAPEWMNHKVRIKCATCRTINVPITEEPAQGSGPSARTGPSGRPRGGGAR
jgi:phage FluMu protein Com